MVKLSLFCVLKNFGKSPGIKFRLMGVAPFGMLILVKDFDFSHLLNSLFNIDVQLKMFKISKYQCKGPMSHYILVPVEGFTPFAGVLHI